MSPIGRRGVEGQKRAPGSSGKRALVLGGVRSGKSEFAVRLATSYGEPVLFVATASASDPEMATRIEAHRLARPPNWSTVEAPMGVGAAIRDQIGLARTLLLDCLSLLVANCLLALVGSEAEPPAQIESAAAASAASRVGEEIDALLEAVSAARCHLVVVTSEVGLGVVPPYPAGRIYRDLLGLANQRVARAVDAVYWVVAGVPVDLKRFTASLDEQ